MFLTQDIKYIQGVGPNRADILNKELDIYNVGDLIAYYPYKYVDRTKFYRISEINGNMPYVQLVGQILSYDQIGEGRTKRLVAHSSDGTGVIDLVWFRATKYIIQSLSPRTNYVVFGKPQLFKGRINVAHPEMEKADADILGENMSNVQYLNYQQQLFDDDEQTVTYSANNTPTKHLPPHHSF